MSSRKKTASTFRDMATRRGAFLIIYRDDKKVQRIEAELLNGREIVFDEWEDDFSIATINDKEWYRGTYKAYDANGELIGEVQY